MGVMRKLRRGHGGKYEVEPLLSERSFPDRKMSEVLLEFAEPVLGGLEDNDKGFKRWIGFAVIWWNISFLQQEERRAIVGALVDDVAGNDFMLREAAENNVRILLERKTLLDPCKDFW